MAETSLQQTFAQLIEQVDAAVAAAGEKSRRAASEEMNQIMRRLRLCISTEQVAAWLVDSTSAYASGAALFEVSGKRLRGVGVRGFAAPADRFEQLEIPIESAPAFGHCVQDSDTVVAIGSAGEVSAAVIEALGHSTDVKVYLYPVVIERETVAVLYATDVDGAAMELLAQAAASAAQILTSSAASGPASRAATEHIETPLIGIAGVDLGAAAKRSTLAQAREARARWQARAVVAGIRLRKREALERGRAARDIYSALKPEIDSARKTYRQDFLAVSPVIADYLHKELLGLANEDTSALGPEYPGSLV